MGVRHSQRLALLERARTFVGEAKAMSDAQLWALITRGLPAAKVPDLETARPEEIDGFLRALAEGALK
jgi:hypothetical protein